MLDNLKDHIDSQRDDFEIYPFDAEEGWKAISKKVSPRRMWTASRVVGVASCVLLVVAGALYQFSPDESLNSELSEMEQFYNVEIDHKVSLVKSQIEDKRVLEDLAQMDQAFADLKADLKDNVDNEEVVAAMMANYQLKLEILEEILRKLEKEKS